MNQAINEMPVTQEEDEAMDALCRLGAGVPLPAKPTKEEWVDYGVENPPQYTAEQIEEIQKTMDKKGEWVSQPQLSPEAIIDEMVAQFSIKLKLLLTVINQTKAQPTQGNSLNAEDQSLQECVSLTLQQAEWFKEMFEEEIENQVGDMSSTIEDRVDAFFSHSFSLDDHVDIDSIVRDKVDDELESIVEDKLADLVSEKLSNLRITFD